MRITGGADRGRKIAVPRSELRPSTERTRLAVFSMLADRIPGARVLDLFAGTGAYGLESLSRGAASVLFVDVGGGSKHVIEKSLEGLGYGGRGRAIKSDVFDFVERSEGRLRGTFDLIFADPPYGDPSAPEEAGAARLIVDPALPALLATGGLFVLETRAGVPLPQPELWQVLRDRRYGTSAILLLAPAGGS